MANTATTTTTKSITEKINELKARIKKIEERAKANERKNEKRREKLIGEGFLALARKPGGSMDEIKKVMNEYLTGDADRKLFDLPPLDKSSKVT